MAKKKDQAEKVVKPSEELGSLDEQLTKVKPAESSSEKSDYASHPKFDKFKSSQGAE